MNRCATIKTLWAMGLDEQAVSVLRQCAEPEYKVKECSPEAFITEDAPEEDAPFAVCLSMKAWRMLRRRYGDAPCAEPPAWILIAENAPFVSELEDAMSQGFAAILKIPLERKRVLNALACAVESWHVHQDIMAMGKEIMLNRELLQRKNDNDRFLVTFLTETAEAFRAEDMLRAAMRCLGEIMPVAGIGALIRHTDASGTLRRFLFIPAMEGSTAWKEWQNALSSAENRLFSLPFLMDADNGADSVDRKKNRSAATRAFSIIESGEPCLAPTTDKKRMLFVPIHAGKRSVGVICAQFARDYNVGRERLMILNAAIKHLGLALRVVFLDSPTMEHDDSCSPSHGDCAGA